MANGHGGARPGAGRKARAVEHAGAVAAAERRIADRLPGLIENLFRLADGGFEQVEERWGPGPPGPDGTSGAPVLVSRKVTWAAPDRAANQYLVDRVLGRPTERHQLSGGDGAPFKVYVGVDLDHV